MKDKIGVLKKILGVGLESQVAEFIRKYIGDVELVELATDGILDIIDKPLNFTPLLVLCGPLATNIPPLECAQLFRSLFPSAPLYFIGAKRRDYDNEEYINNGFIDTFTLVVDEERARIAILEAIAEISRRLAYRSVKLVDIQPTSVVDFDIALLLPKNEKYVKFTKAGDEIGTERFKRLKSGSVNVVYVPMDQISKFHQYVANKLKMLVQSSESSNATANRDQIQNAVRSLFSNVLGNSQKSGRFESAKEILQDCKEIVKNYMAGTPSSGIYSHILSITGETLDSYSHGANTGVFATLIGLGLGLPNSEELSIAGLLHDIGLAEVPLEIQKKHVEERTAAEEEIYRKHVDATIEVIKARKLILTDRIMKAISQHHESYNGLGYPKGLIGDKISIEAQILRIADYLDETTSVEAGRRRLPLEEVIESLRSSLNRASSQLWFDPKLMELVLDLLAEDKPIVQR